MANVCGGAEVRFGGMAQVSDGQKKSPWSIARLRGSTPIGVHSTGLSLGGLLASRARLRFARQQGDTATGSSMQEQSKVVSQADWQKCS